MKKTILILASFLTLGGTPLLAQSWVNGGNTLSTIGRFGTNSNSSVIFETYNTERGRLTKEGLWGFGTKTPNAVVTVNSLSGLSPFRVQLNGATKFLVNGEGGVAIGASVYAPVDGLHVKGKVGIGVVTPNSYTQLEVVNPTQDFGSTGMYTTGFSYGLKAFATAEYGYGVYGNAPYFGVYGNGGSYGIYGVSDYTGMYGDGGSYGVYGVSNSGYGVRGYSNSNYGGSFYSYEGTGLYASTSNGDYAGYFNGDIYTAGIYQGSDQNIKKNIREVGNALSLINQLKPKHYEFKNEAQYASLHLPKGSHYGLLAQDVEAVLPNLVKESAHVIKDPKEAALKPMPNGQPAARVAAPAAPESLKIKAVNYTELIPLLIKGMQEQQQLISTLTNEITQLKATINAGGNSGGKSTGLPGTALEQNQPNPFTQATTFRYTVPAGASAQILIYDGLSGALLKTIPAPATGQAELSGSNLKAGTYVYSLVVDGKQVDSKKMVLAK